jgi:hypothetical protein
MWFPAFAEAHTLISFVVHKGLQYACRRMFKALDPSHIAAKILTAITINRLPFLAG